jgi:hypothetical protein
MTNLQQLQYRKLIKKHSGDTIYKYMTIDLDFEVKLHTSLPPENSGHWMDWSTRHMSLGKLPGTSGDELCFTCSKTLVKL